MKRLSIIMGILITLCGVIKGETWDDIKNSNEYYSAEGTGKTLEEAEGVAFQNLLNQIVVHVKHDFKQIDDVTNKNGDIKHETRVLNCIHSYSQLTLTNVSRWSLEGEKSGKGIRQRVYIKKSEIEKMFASRADKAKNMLDLAEECLKGKKIDMALQYYYWAYSLIRSVQNPNEVKDDRGKILVDRIPLKINEILSDISVDYLKKDGDWVDLLFRYKGEPVSSLEYNYSDGWASCSGRVKDGRGTMQMIPDYNPEFYHVDIEYEYKNQARGDAEIESVLDVITPKPFPRASYTVDAKSAGENLALLNEMKRASEPVANQPAQVPSNPIIASEGSVVNDTVTEKGVDAEKQESINQIVQGIAKAITNRSYSSVNKYFTVDGLSNFNRLTNYGKARIIDASNIRMYKGLHGRTVARGLKMSFSFTGRRKKTFVEDVSFTFDSDNKIESVAFGLGNDTENAIFGSRAAWSPEIREIIVSFMENYKTAYSLERLDYLEQIFADDAVIIVGTMLKKRTSNNRLTDGMSLSLKGQELVKYNRYSKSEYIEHLRRCFGRNEFINLKFTDHQIQWLEKFQDRQLFAINIRQQYESSIYSDMGYLFLMVDMTNPDEPLIKVRTWQPNEVDINKLYNAGDFYND